MQLITHDNSTAIFTCFSYMFPNLAKLVACDGRGLFERNVREVYLCDKVCAGDESASRKVAVTAKA